MKKDYVSLALQYAKEVTSGAILACKWVQLACRRQLDDLQREASEDWPWVFDEEKARRICKFIELLPHIKGQWAKDNQLIILEPWQCFILTTVFGWVHSQTGLRRFKEVYEELPRKNAKSTKSSGIALYMLTADGEQGAEVYSLATKREQARIVFDDSSAMAVKSPDLLRTFGLNVFKGSLFVPNSFSKYEPLASDDSTLDGLNIHFAILDELHAHRTRKVYDVVDTARGAREQSLLWSITTAGTDLSSICYERRTHVTKVLEGIVEDDSLFGIIYTVDEGDDWFDEESWKKANPNYGISVIPDNMATAARKAKISPSALNNFLTKHLNVWVNSGSAWMDMQAWHRCADASLSLDDFAGEPCWIGMDLAEKKDFAALALVFKRSDVWYVFTRLYLNELAVTESANAHLDGWGKQGYVVVTDGNITDFDVIGGDLKSYCERFDVKEIAYDPALSMYFARTLIDAGLPLVEIQQRALFFTQPLLQVSNLVLEGNFKFDGNPVMSWMVSNLVVRESKFNGLRQPVKDRPENKIDGVIAMLMAMGRAMVNGPQKSVYEERGVRFL